MSQRDQNAGLAGRLFDGARLLLPGAFCVAAADVLPHAVAGGEVAGGGVMALLALAGFATVKGAAEAWHSWHLLGHSHRHHDQKLRHDADDDRLFNEHLAAAVGTTIGDILRRPPEGAFAPLDQADIDRLIAVADKAFKEVSRTSVAPIQLADDQLPALVEKAARGDFEPWGEIGMWKAVLGLMIERAGTVTLLSQTLDAAAHACRAGFVRRFFNTIKTDLQHKGAAFASIHLRMMGELLVLARDNIGQQKLSRAKLDELSARLGELSRIIESAVRREMRAELGPVLEWMKRVDVDQVVFRIWATKEDTRELLAGQNEDRQIAGLRHEELVALIRQAINEKSAGAALASAQAPAPPPAVDPLVRKAAERVAADPAATLVERAEAAIVARSPDALSELDRLDAMVDFADFRRHQLRGDYHYFRGEYDASIEPYEKALALRLNDLRVRNDVMSAHTLARLGDIAEHRQRAIDVGQGTLRQVAPGSVDWAGTQNNLGNAWCNKPTGDKGENIDNAIAAYTAALMVRTREGFPTDWAATQNNLGIAWWDKPTGDKGKNIDNAIAAYTAALTVRTRERFPAKWAQTQNNLGAAWQNKPTGDRGENIDNAITAYTAALTVRTRERFPADWAAAQNNLGGAWQKKPTGDKGENIDNAMAAYTAALTVRTRERFPADWAATQNNLGIAWRNKPTGEQGENIDNAIVAYTAALTVRTRERFPADWAATQNNLGTAWQEKPTGDKGVNIDNAIAAYTAALTVRTRARLPAEWARTQNNLGLAWSDKPTGDKGENIDNAIAAYTAALTVRTRERFPVDWAGTQSDLGIALRDKPTGDPRQNLAQAVECFTNALEVFTHRAFPHHHAVVQPNLNDVRAKLAALPPGD